MSEPFIAEVRIFAGNFAPRSWAFCDGQLLPIANNTALFSLIGTTYGGDGRTTTALPNMQARAPMHPGRGPGLTSRRLGERGGVGTVSLSEAQIPSHAHQAYGTATNANSTNPKNAFAATGGGRGQFYYGPATSPGSFEKLANAGSSAAHENHQPLLAMNFIIALQGLYPSRN